MACVRTGRTGRKGSPAAPAQPAREVRCCLGFPRGAGAGLLCLNRVMIAVKPSGQRFFAEQGAMPGESPLRPSGGRGGTKARKFASARRLRHSRGRLSCRRNSNPMAESSVLPRLFPRPEVGPPCLDSAAAVLLSPEKRSRSGGSGPFRRRRSGTERSSRSMVTSLSPGRPGHDP